MASIAARHRPSKCETRCIRRPAKANYVIPDIHLDERLGSLPENAPIVIAGNQEVINFLEAAQSQPTPVHIQNHEGGESATFTGYVITEDLSRDLCQKFHKDLCDSQEKWRAPLILARVTKGRFARVLHRTELPVEIPQTG